MSYLTYPVRESVNDVIIQEKFYALCQSYGQRVESKYFQKKIILCFLNDKGCPWSSNISGRDLSEVLDFASCKKIFIVMNFTLTIFRQRGSHGWFCLTVKGLF